MATIDESLFLLKARNRAILLMFAGQKHGRSAIKQCMSVAAPGVIKAREPLCGVANQVTRT